MKSFSKGLFFFLVLFTFQTGFAKKCLVTGGAGFIGSHLCERLVKDGHTVLCVDNLFTGRMENISHLLSYPNFTFKHHDVTVPFGLDLDLDEIYNLACPASPVHYQFDPVKTILTNVIGATNVLEIARRTHAKLFQASTSEVYGDPLIHPQVETYFGNVNPIGIRSCYDEGKRCAETICFDYNRQYGVNIKVGRIFNTYGPRMFLRDGRVVSNFIVQALQNEPITIYGNGSQTRSFCYVSDLVDAILLFMQTGNECTGPINLGNPEEYTMLELASKVISIASSSSVLTFAPLPQDDPKKRKPDISLAKKYFHWAPKVSVDVGLTATTAYFRKELKEH